MQFHMFYHFFIRFQYYSSNAKNNKSKIRSEILKVQETKDYGSIWW